MVEVRKYQELGVDPYCMLLWGEVLRNYGTTHSQQGVLVDVSIHIGYIGEDERG